MGNRWYAAQIRPQQEEIARLHLAQQKFQAYAPLERRTLIRKSSLITVNVPLFPGYIFINFDISSHIWRTINSTRGVRHLLPLYSEIPLPLPVGLVEGIQQRETTPEKLDDWLTSISEGTLVTLGAAAGYGRRVVKFLGKDRGRVKILFSLFGRDNITSVERRYIAPGPITQHASGF